MKRNLWFIVVLAALSLMWVGRAAAQGSKPTDDQVNAIAKQLFCPVCENTPLDVCGTAACAQWRELIRTKLSEGWSADQIKEYFAAQYGARVLSEPPRQGFNWLVYIVPPVLMLIGVFILFRAYQSMRKPFLAEGDMDEDESSTSGQDDYLRRVEEELKNRS